MRLSFWDTKAVSSWGESLWNLFIGTPSTGAPISVVIAMPAEGPVYPDSVRHLPPEGGGRRVFRQQIYSWFSANSCLPMVLKRAFCSSDSES